MLEVNGQVPGRAGPTPSQAPPPFTGGIVALDIARVTGWAACSRAAYRDWPLTPIDAYNRAPHPEILYGRKEIAPSGESYGRLLHLFDYWLSDLLDTFRPDWVVWEAPILWKKRDTVTNLRRMLPLVGQADLVCYRREIRCREVPIQTAKEYVTGNGNARKPEMVAAIRARGFEPQDDNVADAIAVLDTFIGWRRDQ